MTDINHIRNFAIIAHIDHGKSTLADRLMQSAGVISARELKEQMLDSMDIERERGITIKAQTVRLPCKAADGQDYVLNLMDTPGHVDFSYEVSRCLAACEGSVLIVDASQGVEAQTLANVYKAIEAGHEIIPVLNKVDLPAADLERTREQIEEIIGLDASDAIAVSAKTGLGIDMVFEAIIKTVPPPKSSSEALQALLIDAYYDSYLGVVVIVRIFGGRMREKDKISMMSTGASYEIDQIGVFSPSPKPVDQLGSGEIGFFTAAIKQVADCKIGDTITAGQGQAKSVPLPGFKQVQPLVYCGLFPADAADFNALRAAMNKLRLNDSGFSFETESSAALGLGFRCGFLGLLHLEIIQERLSREFGLDLVATAPGVVYELQLTDGSQMLLHNPADMPAPTRVASIKEPWIEATMLTPEEYLGSILQLCQDRRGVQKQLTFVGARAQLIYELPLNEVAFDFYDRLKSLSRGYASLDYQPLERREGELALMEIRVNEEPIDALSMLVPKRSAEARGRIMCARLKELIPRHMFKIPIQAAIGGRIIARETLAALRKDVTSKCYGGDITRKRKLLEKQKAGKKKMQRFGKVEIPQQAFVAALKMDGPK